MHRSHIITLGALMAACLNLSCGTDPITQPAPGTCSDNTDCDDGESCLGGQCKGILSTRCGEAVFACYDGLARQPADSIQYRPLSRWPRKILTWRLANFLPDLNETKQRTTVGAALAPWALNADLRFQLVEANADITISFERLAHDDEFAFDGPRGILSHAFFPSTAKAGQIHLDLDEDWALEPGTDQIDLYTVLLHEIGHVLGLDHSLVAGAAMSPVYLENERLVLQEADIAAIQRLYGSNDGLEDPLENATPGNLPPPPDLTALGDPDSDGDGIPDTLEVFVYGTDPLDVDSDDDGRSDYQELFIDGTLPTCPGDDSDGDGLPDACESIEGTRLNVADTDGDGLLDGVEVFFGTDPKHPDTDRDGCRDGEDNLPNVFTPDMRDCTICTTAEDCGDAVFCNGLEACDSGRCEPGTDPCPGQLCNEGSDTCVDCLDDSDCTEPETCQAGACGEVECSTDLDCADELFCNGSERCVSGSCEPGIAPCSAAACDDAQDRCGCSPDNPCSDGNPCTSDECVDFVCQFNNNTATCNDNDLCTQNDTCQSGSCAGTPIVCDDELSCTDDSCDSASGCANINNCPAATPMCTPGGCVDSCVAAVDCDDSDPCTDDSCVDNLCFNTVKDCDDGLFCTGTETCNEDTGDCESSAEPCNAPTEICNETDDTCVPVTGCIDDAGCDDEIFCNGAESCSDGSCVAGPDPCPGQLCDEATDSCFVGCLDDGDCDDADACTDDSCNSSTGACEHTAVDCSGGNLCLFCSCEPEFGCACLTCPIDSCNDLFCDPEVGECIYTPLDLCGDGFCDSFCGEDISNCCEDCGSCVCGPGSGDCCVDNGTPGCNDPDCCSSVCIQDPFCCDDFWDCICADEAELLCSDQFCEPVCGDGCCIGDEDFGNCPEDCLG